MSKYALLNVTLKRFKSEENCIKENYTESLPVKVVPPTPEQILSRAKSYFPRGRMQSYEFLML